MVKQLGFSLLELMIILLIGGILVAMAVPAFDIRIKDGRIDRESRLLVSMIKLARSEASQRNQVITMSRSSGIAGDWSRGWRIYTDADALGNTDFAAGDTLIKDINGAAAGYQVEMTGGAAAQNWISFLPNGMLNEGGNTVSIAVCDQRGVGDNDNNGRADGVVIDINIIGRATISPAVTCTP